jgi:Mg-chelatase subunit ChlD
MGLWEFSSRLTPTTDYRVLVPFGPSSASVGSVPRLQAMLASVARLRAKGGTGLYDTTYAAFRAMQAAWQPDTTNVILLITDGRNEYDTGLTLDRLLAQLQREGRPDRPLPIIGVAVGPEADAEALERISQVTGGRTFVVRDPAKAVNTLILAFAGRLR